MFFRILRFIVLSFILFVLILWIGKEYEQYHVRNSPDTLSLYNQQSAVCAIIHDNHSELRIESYESVEKVHQEIDDDNNNEIIIIAHCGECGACSTPHDIQVYDVTKNTLFSSTTNCAKYGFLWSLGFSDYAAMKCMKNSVDLSEDCNTCWVNNIMCDLHKCLYTCLWYQLFNSNIDGTNNNNATNSKSLNACTECDEKRCGPEFVKCAGANRRRTGIQSDIERDEQSEVCQSITPTNWWNDQVLQDTWQKQKQQQKDEESL